jgi:hypothetical protein
MLSMSLHALGAMNDSIDLPAVLLRGFRPHIGFDFRDELMDRFFPLEPDALALVDFVEAHFARLPERFDLGVPFLLLLFQHRNASRTISLALL